MFESNKSYYSSSYSRFEVCLDDLLNIINPYFEQMVDQIYPTELQLNKALFSYTEVPFFGLGLVHKFHLKCMINRIVFI